MRHGLMSLVLLGLAAVIGPGYGDEVHQEVHVAAVAQAIGAIEAEPACAAPEDCEIIWCECAEGPATHRGCSFGVCDARSCDELCAPLGGPVGAR